MSAAANTEKSWTVAGLLEAAQRFLRERGIDTPRLDAELLLCQVLKRNRVYLYTHYDQPVSEDERTALRELIKRRGAHVPVAYLRGEQEFYGLPLEVTPAVLIPRPETEHVVEAALQWLRHSELAAPVIVDAGCGSGALAIALALEVPQAKVWATDASLEALAVAQRNVARHQLTDRITLVHADWLSGHKQKLPPRVDVVVSNPPYVEATARLPRCVAAYEPHAALFAGSDGLEAIRALLPQVRHCLNTPGFVAIEHDDAQAQAVAAMLQEGFGGSDIVRDLADKRRVSVAWRGPAYVPMGRGGPPFAQGTTTQHVKASAAPDDASVPHVQLDDPQAARD